MSTDSKQRSFQDERTFGNTPNVLTTLDDTTIRGSDVFGGANDREGDGVDEHLSMLSILVVVKRRGVNSDPLSRNNLANLETRLSTPPVITFDRRERTRCLKVKRSFWVRVSALATTGIRLTRVPNRFMTSISKGFKLQRPLARFLK
jgi:hypothetical protein